MQSKNNLVDIRTKADGRGEVQLVYKMTFYVRIEEPRKKDIQTYNAIPKLLGKGKKEGPKHSRTTFLVLNFPKIIE